MYKSQQSTKTEGREYDNNTGYAPESACIEAVEIYPAAVFAADEYDHSNICYSVDYSRQDCGDKSFFAYDMYIFGKA